MIEGNGYDKEYFQQKAKYMRSFIDYSKNGRFVLDVGKNDLIDAVLDNVERPKEWGQSRTKTKEYLRKVFKFCEETQEKAFLEGKSSIYTFNGYLYLKKVNGKPINNNINTQYKEIPPKSKIAYREGTKIRTLNEALRRMSFEQKEKDEENTKDENEKVNN